MISPASDQYKVAIACGGTGGHLFPGLAVAGQLTSHGARVTLIVSPKEVDQLAVKTAKDFEILTLPSIGLTAGSVRPFVSGFIQSYRTILKYFRQEPPHAVLAMGGFTSAPPILAAKQFRAATFLHESNSVPGRANRWLSWIVDRVFISFPSAKRRLHNRKVTFTGTPVRAKFRTLDPATCRASLGLEPERPVALVMGGSQGAHGINELVLKALPLAAKQGPDWQWIHLAGAADEETLRNRYAALGLLARVYSFFDQMDLAMGAATASISRAGASSLAELATMRLPAILIPFPSAIDNHQFHNARAFEKTGAAYLLEQQTASPEELVRCFAELMCSKPVRDRMQAGLTAWHMPHAADQIAQAILESVRMRPYPQSSMPPVQRGTPSGSAGTDYSSSSRMSGCESFHRNVAQPGLKKGFFS